MLSFGIVRQIVTLLGVGFVAYAGLVFCLWAAQGWMIFPGRASSGTTPFEVPERSVELEGLRVNGNPLYGLFLPAETVERSGQALLFFGGNAEYVAVQVPELETLRDFGADVLAIDYPGFGGSGGQPSEGALADAALAAYDELARRAPGRQVVVVGRSLGAFSALKVAAERDVSKAVLLAPFTSTTAMARKTMPFVPVGALLRHRLNNLETLKDVDIPVIVIHNRDDEIVPFEMGEAIAAAAGEQGRLIESDGGGHNSMGILHGTREAELIAEILAKAR